MMLKKTFKNSIFAISSYMTIGILTFVMRKLFLISLDDIFLGYEGVILNILEIISILNLGLDIIVYYRMEQAYGLGDKCEIGKLFDFYNKFLFFINFVLLILSCICLSFLACRKAINVNICLIFLLLLLSFDIQGFINSHRLLFILMQEDYVYSMVDFFVQFFSYAIRIIILVFVRNYIIYLASFVGICFFELVILRHNIKIKYYDIYISKFENMNKFDFIKISGILNDVKSNIFHKISLVVYGATDNIIISMIWGVEKVSYLSNYYMMIGVFNSAMMKLIDPFQAAIGKIVNSKDDNRQLFEIFNCVGYIIACFMFFFSYVIINDAVRIIYGDKYFVDKIFVLFFSINQYITWNHKFLCYYRNLFGRYDLDKWFLVCGAVLNIFISIYLSFILGLSGIILGTCISHVLIWAGRVKVVYSIYLIEGKIDYIIAQIKQIIMTGILAFALSYLCSFDSNGLLDYIAKWFFGFLATCVICLTGVYISYDKDMIKDLKKYIFVFQK